MAINKLYFSYGTYKFDYQLSSLLNDRNCQKIINSIVDTNCHTSSSDLSSSNIKSAVKNAKEIFIIEINFTDLIYEHGMLLHSLLDTNASINFVNCKNFDAFTTINKLNQIRPTDNTVLWMAGCSITAGEAVHNLERYGSLLSTHLNLPEVMLARNGSSILYSADQILRSDIRNGDIVVWGLTSIARVEICDTLDFNPIALQPNGLIDNNVKYWSLDYFSSPTQILTHIRMIMQVINFCKKINAKLYLANMLDISWIPVVFKNYDNFIDFTKISELTGKITFIDFGTDNAHPGPKQHQHYAEQIFNLIERGN